GHACMVQGVRHSGRDDVGGGTRRSATPGPTRLLPQFGRGSGRQAPRLGVPVLALRRVGPPLTALTAPKVRRGSVRLVTLLAVAILLPTAIAQGPAPTVLVGVITSLTGEARGAGASQALAAEGWEEAAEAGG